MVRKNNNLPQPEIEVDDYMPGVCYLHSGVMVWLKGVVGLLVILNGLVGFQVFYQVPKLRLEVTQRMDKLENRVQTAEKEIIGLKMVRNIDHSKSMPIQ